jgi:hypothetical protein
VLLADKRKQPVVDPTAREELKDNDIIRAENVHTIVNAARTSARATQAR